MKNTAPLISIIIPTRNRAALLKSALESCANQSYKNLQIIVHDNNSSDGTKKVVQRMVTDKRIAYYNSGRDLTMQDNWNCAASHIKGDYFLRLDDDNILSPTIIEEALKNMHQHNLQCITYLPVVVYPLKRRIIFFKESEKIHLLSATQLTYLNYFCIIDSNYAVYKTRIVKSLLGKKFYSTTLPDRHMDYILACNVKKEGIRYGLCTKINGITRFDHRQYEKTASSGALNFSNIIKKYSKTNLDDIDCHDNFLLHRYLTAMIAMTKRGNGTVCQYFNTKITTFNIHKIMGLIGTLYEFNRFYSIQDFKAYSTVFLYVILKLLANPNLVIEGRRSYAQIFFLFAMITRRIQKSMFSRISQKIDYEFGNELCRRMMSGEKLHMEQIKSKYGDADIFLKKIGKLKIVGC